MPPVVCDGILGPQAPDDLHALGQATHPLGQRHPEDRELLRAVAESDAQHESPPGGDVEERADLRDLDRVVQRQQHQVGADGEALRLGGEPLQHGEQREVVKAGRRVVLAAPQRVEAERADEAHLLDGLGKAAGGIVARGMLRVQIDAELHGSLHETAMVCDHDP